MKLDATIGEIQTAIQIRDEGSQVFADVDGRSYRLDVRPKAPGRFTVICEGQVFDCRVQGSVESDESVAVVVGTKEFSVGIVDPKRLGIAASASAHGGEARIIAPMPGKVVRVMVEVGTEVDAGAGIVVVEAMKMQNEMKSPKAGKVSELNVQPGVTVNAGDVLAIVE
ncbi:MAG TPA: biotin/lipoyl-containing protein [Pyrinomonadaceae bacterium]|nr:biotin/lipoyl-containing protein [Pyrinomonadaceae bacterium]